jgi:hypothetical protein
MRPLICGVADMWSLVQDAIRNGTGVGPASIVWGAPKDKYEPSLHSSAPISSAYI